MGILSRYILKEHLAPFLLGLVVTTFVLIVDLIPNMVELIIGKNLDAFTVIWAFILNLAWILVLAVPMACLIATLMAFGRLSSDFEILAMKTSGINIFRMILPVLAATFVLAIGLVWFNNAVLPDANHKARILMSDIRVMRPTLSIKSNIFINDIPGYFILIGEVDHKTSRIQNVLIFDQRTINTRRTITAERGYLEFLEGGQVLSFELEDGEIYEANPRDPEQYKRVTFKKQVFNIQDISRELRQTESDQRGDREMSTSQMLAETRTLRENAQVYRSEISKIALSFRDPHEAIRGSKNAKTDSLPRSELGCVMDVLTNFRNTKSVLTGDLRKINQLEKSINVYRLEVHKKFSIPAACIIFVLVGAPLGILARRGGMGTAIGISVGLFIIYWAFLIGGEELSDREFISPVTAMWLPNVLIGIIGLLLLRRVITEKSIFRIVTVFANSSIGLKLTDWWEKSGAFLRGELEKHTVGIRQKSIWKTRLRPLKIIDGYLLGKFVRAFLLSLVIFVLVMHLVHLIEHLDTYIDKNARIRDIAAFYLYYTPFILALTIPIATLLGAIFTIGLMARRNELLAIKASGISLWRVAFPLLIAGLLISLAVFYASDKILPFTNQKKSEILYANIDKTPDYQEEYYNNFHRRGDQGRIFNFQLYSPKQRMGKEVQIQTYNNNSLAEMIEAKELTWKDSVWVALKGEKTIFSSIDRPSKSDSVIKFDTLVLSDLTETPKRFARRVTDPRDFGYDQTIQNLKDEIQNKQANGIDPTPEKVYLMFKYSLPMASFIIVLMAVPLAANPRRGSPAIGFAFAISISFFYMIIFEVFRTLGTTGKIRPVIAAWSINAVFALAGLVMMIKVRK